ncbi:MAG: DUF3783 domain-containing protein [Lachnospiraceae bacterium]|nr:DUF3783 domain-containing protein [Lachnospiraceae bacterium]
MNDINILLYTKDTEKKQAIMKITKSIDLKFGELKANQANDLISSIVGLPTFTTFGTMDETNKKAPALWSMPELVLFFGVPDAKLDAFLAEYKKTGLERIKLKAIVTPTNLNWSLYYLIEHLKEEAKAFE